jgi:ATP dependent DNA ligase domain/ATP dependent DNA ligase C terminal region
VAVDDNGRVSFNLIQHHRSQAQALLFYAFDVLICRGKSLVNVPLEERRKVLSEIFEKVRSKDSPIKLSETIDVTPTELVRVAKQLGFEGILAKRRDSVYESGKRSGAWLKYRINRDQELVIGGYVAGNPIDSIIVGYYQDGTLLYTGKVRNGFVPHTRREVAAKLKGFEIATCPFANLPERKRAWLSRFGGVFLKDEKGNTYLGHSFRIGGGKVKGFTRDAFRSYCRRNGTKESFTDDAVCKIMISWPEPNGRFPGLCIGNITSPRLPQRVREFTRLRLACRDELMHPTHQGGGQKRSVSKSKKHS